MSKVKQPNSSKVQIYCMNMLLSLPQHLRWISLQILLLLSEKW